jgi:hypothetical protein
MDATSRSVEKFLNPKLWPNAWHELRQGEYYERDVPIFVTHDIYQQGQSGPQVAMPMGERPQGDDWRFLYRVDDNRLKKIANNINRMWDADAAPVRIQIGHTKLDNIRDQVNQPEHIGYGIGARVGPWRSGRNAIFLDKTFYKKGKFPGDSYPERSPEFYGFNDLITTLALLRTDPKLKMGMTLYNQIKPNGCTFYGKGIGFMPAPTMTAAQRATAMRQRARRGIGHVGFYEGEPPPAPNPTAEPDAEAGPQVDEAEKQKFMDYFTACMPEIISAIKQALSGGENPGEEPLGGEPPMGGGEPPMGGGEPPMGGAPPPPEEPGTKATPMQNTLIAAQLKNLQMSQDKLVFQYNLEKMKGEVTNLVLVDKVLIHEPQKLAEKLARMPNDKMRYDYISEVKTNWHRDPSASMIPPNLGQPFVYQGNVEGGIDPAKNDPDYVETKHAELAIMYQRSHPHITWDEALEKTAGK